MIKNLTRAFIAIIIILLIIYFFSQREVHSIRGNYISVVFNTKTDSLKGIEVMENRGFSDLVHIDNITIPVNKIPNIEEMGLDEIKEKLDDVDYRNDPFIKSIDKLFIDKDGRFTVYVKKDRSDRLGALKLYRVLKDSGVSYRFADPLFLRLTLNFLSFGFILFVIGFGCKKRGIISLLFVPLIIFLLDLTTYNSFVITVLLYISLIMVVEVSSLSNRYIKRDNLGGIRMFIAVVLFLVPTFLPMFLDSNFQVKSFNSNGLDKFSINSLNGSYSMDNPNISNFYTHYAFQDSYLYGGKYLFPEVNQTIILDEYKRVNHYLEMEERVVMVFDDEYFNSFLKYLESSNLGRFYLDYGYPFKVEERSFLSLYIMEKEYMQKAILAGIIFLSSFLFIKRKEKNKF